MTIYELRYSLLALRWMDSARIHDGQLVITDAGDVILVRVPLDYDLSDTISDLYINRSYLVDSIVDAVKKLCSKYGETLMAHRNVYISMDENDDDEIINKLALFHGSKPKNTSASGDTIAIPRGMIEKLVKLAESAHHDNIDTYKNMVVGAVILLRAYLPEEDEELYD